jgi:hypothetical protein
MKDIRINTNLPAQYAKEFKQIGEKSTSKNAIIAIEGFIDIKKRTMKEIHGFFEEREIKYLVDIANATMFDSNFAAQKMTLIASIEDSDRYEGTGEKWDVDVQGLIGKIDKLTSAQCYFLQRETYLFWYETDKAKDLEEFVRKLK